MATIGSALVYIRAKTDDLKKDLGLAEKDVEGSASKMNMSISDVNWKAVGAAALAFGAVVGGVAVKAVKAAGEQEKAEAKLAAVVKSTGEAAGFSAEEMFKMAGELQRVTTFGDETTISGMAVLATFKQIGGEAFPRTIKAAADMASVMGTDLQSAIVMIGKAMNDPIANLSAMSRAGVQFTDDQKIMIRELWKAGDALGAQKIILTELESQFGGTSEAMRDTFGGAVTGATNALGDMWEEIGFAITKNKALVESVGDLENAVISMTPALAEFAKNTIYLFQDIAWAIAETDKGLLKFYNFLIGNALKQSFIQKDWLDDTAALTLEIDNLLDSYFSGIDTFKKVEIAYATMADAMEDSYLDYGAAVEEQDAKLNTSMKDNWDDTMGSIGEGTKRLESDQATAWHNIQANMTRELNLMGDNWEKHIGEPASRVLKSTNDQNLMSLQEMRGDWERESETIGAQFKKSALDAIETDLNFFSDTNGVWEEFNTTLSSSFNKNVGIMVEDFRTGSGNMATIGELASESISEALGSYANKMFMKVFDTLIDLIAVNIGLGAAGSGAGAATGGGWAAAGAKMLTFAGAAGLAMVASRAAAVDNFAEGGWISKNPTGGWIQQGSGIQDDVFLGSTGNINHWGMGGEFVVNQKSSKEFAPLLEAINSNKGYSTGGEMVDHLKSIPGTWKETALMLQGGLAASFGHGTLKGGPYVGLAEMAAFAGTGIGGAFLMKAGKKGLGGGNLGFAEGGMIPGGAHVGHGGIGGWDPVGDVKDAFKSGTESLSDSFSGLSDIGGDFWEHLKEGHLDQAFLDFIDLTHESLVMATPDFMRPLLPDNPVDIIRRLVDPEFILEMLIESLVGPLETVSKDLREPGKLWSNPINLIEDMIQSATKILDATTGIDVDEFLDGIGFKNGTNFVPNDGLAYVHKGEQIIPANQNFEGGGINIHVHGNIIAEDLAGIISRGMEQANDDRIGMPFQSINISEVGIK